MGRLIATARERFPVEDRYYKVLATVIFALLVVIVFTGAAVRVTGSGLGCPTWPKCTHSTVYTNSFAAPGLIEFGNRVITALITLAVVAGVVGAVLRRTFRWDLFWYALACFAGVVAQAVIGGLSVIYHLAPGFVMGHYVLSMIVIIAGYGLYWRAISEPYVDVPGGDFATVVATRALFVLGGAAIVLGTAATAAGPHAGGAGTNDVVTRLYFKGSDTLDWTIHVHGYVVTAFGLASIAMWWFARRREAIPELRRTYTRLCVLLALQGALGIVQYETHLPEGVVWVHVILATLTWVGLVRAWAYAGPLPARSPDAELTPRSARRPAPRASASPR